MSFFCLFTTGLKINNTFIVRALYFSSQPNYETAKNVGKVVNVAIIGAPNAGKSTLINKILDRKVSILKYIVFLLKYILYFI